MRRSASSTAFTQPYFKEAEEREAKLGMQLVTLLQLSLRLLCAYAAGEVAERWLSCPALVAEIVVGMCLGPNGLDLVPFSEALSAAGSLGLLLIILEGGLNIELATMRRVGWKAFAIAISGTTLPVAVSLAVLPALPLPGARRVGSRRSYTTSL